MSMSGKSPTFRNYSLFVWAGLSLAVGIVFFSGCTRPPVKTGERIPPVVKTWETVWVEPTMLISDSLFTLIRSERIDSVVVDTRKVPHQVKMPSIAFYIANPSCFVTVNLLGPTQSIQQPLVARRLGRGYYKLTLIMNPAFTGPLETDHWYLQATYCGKTKLTPIQLR